MVQTRKQFPLNNDGSVNISVWIESFDFPTANKALLKSACQLAQLAASDQATDFEISIFTFALEIAETLYELDLDAESVIAGMLFPIVEHSDLSLESISEHTNDKITHLISGVMHLNKINQLNQQKSNKHQIDNIRKMLLAMVQDVRVVAIKLVEHLAKMRAAQNQKESLRKQLALETKDIFAPLASRLGLEKIKWELEDLALYELDKNAYKEISQKIAERRIDREKRIEEIVAILTAKAKTAGITKIKIYGRPKHIYSIKKKMDRKHVPFEQIFDANAFRIIVPKIKDCYKMLSFVHEMWEPIPQEFDDYIASPKPNGYQSIHTAVIGPNNKNIEVQIRTFSMNELAESGIAAHWFYKDERKKLSSFDAKIDWLRQLLEWHKELSPDEATKEKLEKNIFEDRIYVFTPQGDIVDLPKGSTALDFAYHIHTEVGHRCRGAKVNGKITPLTTPLATGKKVEIITAKSSSPSRDWLIPQRGYLHTANARAKVYQWFKKQDVDLHISEGRAILDRECQRLNISNPNLSLASNQLCFASIDKMLASLGSGDLRLQQIINIIAKEKPVEVKEKVIHEKPIVSKTGKDQVTVSGVGNLLSRIAKCCKPVPGDPIIGYITQGKGIAIHHCDCSNIAHTDNSHTNRFVEVKWNIAAPKTYPVDIEISVYDRAGILRDITNTLANNNINLLSINTANNNSENTVIIFITIEISDLEKLGKILDHLNQIPNVHHIKRRL